MLDGPIKKKEDERDDAKDEDRILANKHKEL
jgi:hypothetical protein